MRKQKVYELENVSEELSDSRKEEHFVVPKTYKMFVNGNFIRSEQGHVLSYKDGLRVPRASKKDIRDAVIAAASALHKWEQYSPFLKSQIIYRMAEMLSSRINEFVAELNKGIIDLSEEAAKKEIEHTIQAIFHYAGWADKFQHIISCVNPVVSSYFCFSIPEPVGILGVIPSVNEKYGYMAIPVIMIISAITAGNSVIIIAPEANPFPLLSFAEVISTSDCPPGLINILTGKLTEILPVLTSHMRVNGLFTTEGEHEITALIRANAAINVKRFIKATENEILNFTENSLDLINKLVEIKTIWHPIEWIPELSPGKY